MSATRPFNFGEWIDSNRHLLKPPVGNKLLFPVDDFIIMVVGGPNARSDFHVDPGEEFFYQLEGDMMLQHRAGQAASSTSPSARARCSCCPANLPHSPQRQADTVGLVIERRASRGEQDGLQWYCEQLQPQAVRRVLRTHQHRDAVPRRCSSVTTTASQHRTCRRCGTVAPVPEVPVEERLT